MRSLRAYRREQHGASAVEFALVIPLAVALVLGVIHMSFIVYSAVALHYATEATARCLSVSANNPAGATTTCPSASNVQTYGTSWYKGPGISPTFSVGATAACSKGQQVTASGSYSMALGLVNLTIPISAAACYPY